MDVPSIEDRAAIDKLRETLSARGFSPSGITEALGEGATDVVRRTRARAMQPDDPLGVLIRLFLLGDLLPVEQVSPHLAIDSLVGLGVLARTDITVRSVVRIVAVEDMVFAGEPDDPNDLRADRVPSVHAASTTLAHLTVRVNAGRALDLGTGCGVQALMAARHSDFVVGVDVNKRAVGFARLNAALNSVSNVGFLQASFFQPLRRGAFDLVVANPPFVISPDSSFVFRDAGAKGESLSQHVVQQAAGALHSGGYASVLCNWVTDDDRRWWEPATRWVKGHGCDAWVLQAALEDPIAYAASFNSLLALSDSGEFERVVSRWSDWYAAEGIQRIAIGAIVLRKRAGTNWYRAASLVDPGSGWGSARLLRMFEGVDAVVNLATADAPACVFVPIEGHWIEEVIPFEEGGYRPGRTVVRGSNGPGLQVILDPLTLPALFACDGTRTLAECVQIAEDKIGAGKGDLLLPSVDAVKALTEAGYFMRLT